MKITFIYQNTERNRAEEIGQYLEKRGYDIGYAPVGLQAGTPEWKFAAKEVLIDSDVIILLVTKLSVVDEWVAWRVNETFIHKLIFVPILLDEDLPDRSTWVLPEQFNRYNWLRLHPSYWDESIQRLLRFLPENLISASCFISYSRANKSIADRLRSDLQKEHIKVWRDVDDIPAGTSWDDQIAQAIITCSHVLLLVTNQSVKSPNVADEISFAREEKKPIIPLLFEKAKLPLRIHRSQAIDFTQDYDSGLKRLLAELRGKK